MSPGVPDIRIHPENYLFSGMRLSHACHLKSKNYLVHLAFVSIELVGMIMSSGLNFLSGCSRTLRMRYPLDANRLFFFLITLCFCLSSMREFSIILYCYKLIRN